MKLPLSPWFLCVCGKLTLSLFPLSHCIINSSVIQEISKLSRTQNRTYLLAILKEGI